MTARKYPVGRVLQDHGIAPTYSSAQTAKMLGVTKQGLNKMVRDGRIFDKEGEAFVPAFDGFQYVWESEDVECAAISLYRSKRIDMAKLKYVVRQLLKDRGEVDDRYA